ncbi:MULTISPECIES: YlbF family regulator [Caproicibacterium]|uniref:YlbF family regulator n=1 Tax=Caproicibacterium argilliputei TaxID=3030016 RepID=A0AA97D7Z8_9FIRM|nr:YlbF family regulator [Caproicibacterium argilliputei]WOC31332.1 YlbF family regulator [Caproicibacterium argilliputei]
MDVIEATRELGKTLQADPRFSRMQEIAAQCDKDKELQDKIGNFNLQRMNLNNEMQKTPRDEEKVNQLNETLQTVYKDVMANPNMVLYTAAQQEMDALLKRVYGIISKCADGEDPTTADYDACTHDCTTCGGCH